MSVAGLPHSTAIDVVKAAATASPHHLTKARRLAYAAARKTIPRLSAATKALIDRAVDTIIAKRWNRYHVRHVLAGDALRVPFKVRVPFVRARRQARLDRELWAYIETLPVEGEDDDEDDEK